eukprot:gb/GFBE01036226.1/.p1 GENE.gb/GFBE01036226.1/~~gb/GFBE01036226.1/.p1  ORF type:complete len:110 (+),score=15.06 gb/GFBE01036226.1/:1-330(+)
MIASRPFFKTYSTAPVQRPAVRSGRAGRRRALVSALEAYAASTAAAPHADSCFLGLWRSFAGRPEAQKSCDSQRLEKVISVDKLSQDADTASTASPATPVTPRSCGEDV